VTHPLLCIVVPCYKEKDNINVLLSRIEKVFQNMEAPVRYAVILVDDGSPDATFTIIEAEAAKKDSVFGLRFSRNFGKEQAMTAGVAYAIQTLKADAVLCMDADLQHPPEYIPQFIRHWQAGDAVVVGVRNTIADPPLLKSLGSWAFGRLMQLFSEVESVKNASDYRLLDKKVAKVVLRMREHSRLFRGLVDWTGFRRGYVFFDAPARKQGERGYTLTKLFSLAVNGITSFSLFPLRLIGCLGLLVTCCALLTMTYMLITDIAHISFYTPLAYVVVFLTILMGILLSGMGIIALYIGQIHRDVMDRPLYLIEHVITPTGHTAPNEEML